MRRWIRSKGADADASLGGLAESLDQVVSSARRVRASG
jgi:hypothetical protein